MDWSEFFRDTWQTSLVFFTLLVFTRILGKTQVGQLTFYEYINGITIGSIAANVAASEPDKVWSHFYDFSLFVLLTYLLAWVTLKNRRLRTLVDGQPTVVIENGLILEQNMAGMRYNLDELNAQLRAKGILDPSEVQYAIFETTGQLSIIKKPALQPVTNGALSVQTGELNLPIELIMDGQVIDDNLSKYHLSRQWLQRQLAARGITDPAIVTYAVLDSKGQFFLSRRSSKSDQDNRL